jgi:hypothetical protein
MRASWEALHAGLDRSLRTLQADQAFQQAKQQCPALAGACPWNGDALHRDVHDALSALKPRHELLKSFVRGARLSLEQCGWSVTAQILEIP